MGKTKRITHRIPEQLNKELEALEKKEGWATRAAIINHAIRFYIKNKSMDTRTVERPAPYQDQLDRIEDKLKELQEQKIQLEQIKQEKDCELLSVDDTKIKNFDQVSNDILELLASWGSMVEISITRHFTNTYPSWVVGAALMKLKEKNKVKVQDGKWRLNKVE